MSGMQLTEWIAGLNKNQLYEIAISDKPMEWRYESARELQARRLNDDMITDIVRLYPFKTPTEIGEYLGVPRSTVVNTAKRLGLPKRRLGA